MLGLKFSHWTAFLSSTFLLFDNALVAQSRFILLDSMLLFFILLACTLYVYGRQREPLSWSWWGFMVGTGVTLACSVGVKFVGLSATALLGSLVARDMWRALGNQRNSMRLLLKQTLALLFSLIGIAVTTYVLFFYIHFLALRKSGPGDAFMSIKFQVRACTILWNGRSKEGRKYRKAEQKKERRKFQ